MSMLTSIEPRKVNKLRYAEYYDMTETFDELYSQSQGGKVFTNLMKYIRSEENILLAFRNIKNNDGSTTKGVDKDTIRELENIPQEDFIEIIKEMLDWYNPKPVKRVEIPKPNGKMRPLGIPAIWDRMVQQCILQVLEPICEAKFYCDSYGFRPNRSAEHAMSRCYQMIQLQKLYHVVDIDIKGFFDNVDHNKLIRQMWSLGIRDQKLICIIKSMLKAPVLLPNGKMEYPGKGTPQGGILSPLLANIVLNELDWWIASQWKYFPTKNQYAEGKDKRGLPIVSHKYTAMRTTNLKEMYIVRYADDFKIFCRKHDDAVKVYESVKQWLKQRLKLDISEEKSKVVSLRDEWSEYLGFKFKAVKRHGKYVVESHMSDKAKETKYRLLKKMILEIQRPANDKEEAKAVNRFNAMVIGMHNYYRIATHVAFDFRDISYPLYQVTENRLGERLSRKGTVNNQYIKNKYGRSKQLRFVGGTPLCPAGYVQFKLPISKKQRISPYTKDGRAEIHKSLQNADIDIMKRLMREMTAEKSVEYMDNRVSLYVAQNGKCSITGQYLRYDDIHCHHVKPRACGGGDEYKNLRIVHKDIHVLIHATNPETINLYVKITGINDNSLKKLNSLRKAAGNKPITI